MISRRQLFKGLGGLGAGAALSACSVSTSSGGSGPKATSLAFDLPETGAKLPTGATTVRWLNGGPGPKTYFFNDFIADPWQIRDLAADPPHGDTLRRLLAVLRRRQGELDDPSGGWVDQIDESWHQPEDAVGSRRPALACGIVDAVGGLADRVVR